MSARISARGSLRNGGRWDVFAMSLQLPLRAERLVQNIFTKRSKTAMTALYGAPLCPAGHLPHMGGDRTSFLVSPITIVERLMARLTLRISPHVGEMSDWTEGVAKDRGLNRIFEGTL